MFMKKWIHAKTDYSDVEGMLLKQYFGPYGLDIKYYPGTDEFVVISPELPYPYIGCREVPRERVETLTQKQIESIANAAKRASDKYQYNRRYITPELEHYVNSLKQPRGEFSWANLEQVNDRRGSIVELSLGPMRESIERISHQHVDSVYYKYLPKEVRDAVDDRLDEIIDDVESLGFIFVKRLNLTSYNCFELQFAPDEH